MKSETQSSIDPIAKPRPGRHNPLWAVAIFGAGALAARHFHLLTKLPQAFDWFRALGPWGAAAFVAAYVVACVLFLPASVFTLGAGALFGVPLGFALVSLASTLAATTCFLLARFVARDWLASKAEGNAKFAALDAAVAREGWKIVGLLRLSPVIPFGLLNYALGITSVKLRDFVWASWLGMMPGTLLYVWLGALAGGAAQASGGAHRRTPAEWAFFTTGLLATLAVTVLATRFAKRAVNERLRSNPPPP